VNRRSFVAMTGARALAVGVVAHVSTSPFGTLRQIAAVIALLDALNIERAVLAGYDWVGRAACVAAARGSR